MLEAGQQIQHYRLIEKIGEGGMGVVWKAEDTRLHRQVALKFVPDQDAQTVDRHLREARAASALNHPHICSIHDIGDYEGRRFIVMELLEGETLHRKIAGGPLEIDQAVELAAQIADALAAAHEKGIIHRDIKAANIFISGQRAKMLDFGLAKLAEKHEPHADAPTKTELDQTTPGMVVGTVNYMSPEQALGRELDHRTDIFSFGVVLYEMITGRRAFEGNTSAAVFDAILNKTPTAPVQLNADVPEELQRVVDKALEKDPDLRYQSAAGLRADLKRLQRHAPGGLAQLIDRPEKAPRIRTIAAIVSAVIVLTVAGSIYWKSQEEGDAPPSPEVAATLSKGPSIAVLPFVNASGDPEQDYFATGLAQEIITELTRYPDLNVVARYSTFGYEGDPTDLDRIREELGGVRYVLRGNVARAGDAIRVTAELSDTRDGSRLWGESYTRDLTATDFFALQDELTNQVVGAITSSYGPISRAGLAEARRKPPESLDSYDCILRAYEYLNIHEPPRHLAARDCLEQAVEGDADYADAWAWLAYTYAEEQRHQWNVRPGYDPLERALEAAYRSLDADATNQVARAALALTFYQRRDVDRFRVEAEQTIALNPNNELWLGYMGLRFCTLDECDRGAEMVRQALKFNPNPPPWYYTAIFWDDYNHGRYEEALKHALREQTSYRAFVYRAACLARLGRPEEARRALEEMRASGFPVPDDLRRDMIEQQGFAPAVADRLLEPLHELGVLGVRSNP